MRIINSSELLVTIDDLLKCVDGSCRDSLWNTINKGTERNRKGQSDSYRHVKDGVVYIYYKSIPARAIKKYCLPQESDLIKQLNNPIEKQRTAKERILNAVEATPEDLSYYIEKEIPRKHADDYARGAGWMRFVTPLTRTTARKYGDFKSLPDFHEFVMALIREEELANFAIRNRRVFLRRMEPWKLYLNNPKEQSLRTAALDSMISGKIGNANRLKMSDWHVNQLIKLARDGRQLEPAQLWEDMCRIIDEHNHKTGDNKEHVTRQTVCNWLLKQEFRTRVAKERGGAMLWKNNKLFISTRDGASVPDALWWIDGTPEELWFFDQQANKLQRRYVVKVQDDYSKCFVGYAIGETENMDLIYRAVKSAVKYNGTMAYQLTSDKGSSMQSKVMTEWFAQLFKWYTPTATGMARSKIIEPEQAIFRKQFLSRMPNHSFGNITSNGPQANKDYIKEHFREFPCSEQELRNQIEFLINEHNHYRNEKSRGKSPHDLYQEEYDDRRRVNDSLFVDRFYLWKRDSYKYTPEGLVMVWNKQRYEYVAPVQITANSSEEDCRKVAQFMNENIDRRFSVKFDPDDLSRIALYFEDKLHAYAYLKAHTKRALYDTTTEDAKLLAVHNLIRKMQVEDVKEFYRKNDEYVDAHGQAKQAFTIRRNYKNDNNAAEEQIKHIEISEGKEVRITKWTV